MENPATRESVPVLIQSSPPCIGSSTPMAWRLAIGASIFFIAGAAYLFREAFGLRGQAATGVVFFFGLIAVFSSNLRAVNWRTIGCGFGLQLILALLVLNGQVVLGGRVYSVKHALERVGELFKSFIGFSDRGAEFVFGNLARPEHLGKVYGSDFLFPFAFKVMPSILFVSAFFTLLYHYGVVQWCVRQMARVMTYLMCTSGAETLSVSANVFMGQTEAPLIVKPYVPGMTNSELFTLMVSGFAHISGGMMIVYINYGADPAAVLTTCVMACPCSLYLSKLFLPELAIPETASSATISHEKSPYVNAIDAISSGTKDGLQLALNVCAMLIVFIAFVAMFDALLGTIKPALLWFGVSELSLRAWPEQLTLAKLLGWLFAPAAFLIGIELTDVQHVGSLLGSKLAINEHFAYLQFKTLAETNPEFITERSKILAAFALTGFANFASVGIQLGGIGAIAPKRQHDLARLGGRALFVGFVATLLNAAIAGVFL
ncbi:MAG: nupX [Planctomycetaceae bacterium]|nr:nupX [Planctomycetaceae bacterium]